MLDGPVENKAKTDELAAYSVTIMGRNTTGRIFPSKEPVMSRVWVQLFAISLDGFGVGEGQDADAQSGHPGDRPHEWLFATEW